MSESLPPLGLQLCPTCEGVAGARDDCPGCEGAGLFDGEGRPFYPPPPFDGWEPSRLVALEQASAARRWGGTPPPETSTERSYDVARKRTLQPVPEAPTNRRLSMSAIVEMLLTRSPADHSTIRLTRNAKGDTQVDVSIRTGEAGLETVEQARAKCEETYDHLCALYPMKGGE